jgi:hypothetical protein
MPRTRSLKQDFFKDEDLCSLPMECRLFFAGMWCQADREGRLEYRPKRLKVEIMPFDDVDVSAICQKLQNPGIDHRPEKKFIIIYEVDGQKYIQLLNFKKHQRPHHLEKPSSIPPADKSLKDNNTCQSTSMDVKVPDNNGINPSGSGFLVLENGCLNKGACSPIPDEDEPSPLEPQCLADHSWDAFRQKWTPALRNGKFRDEEACHVKWNRTPAMWSTWLACEDNYVVSKDVKDGFAMNPMKFLSAGWKDWQTKEEPTGAGEQLTHPDRSWKEDRDNDERAIQEFEQGITAGEVIVRPRDRMPWETPEQYERLKNEGKLVMVKR